MDINQKKKNAKRRQVHVQNVGYCILRLLINKHIYSEVYKIHQLTNFHYLRYEVIKYIDMTMNALTNTESRYFDLLFNCQILRF